MTSTSDLLPLDGCDDAASVLAHARAQRRVEEDAARGVMRAAARWASMHSTASLVGPADGWHESCLPLGGEGCPEVAEFAVVEFAASLGKSTEAGRRYLSHAVEGCYRLTRCWARLEAGELQAWRLGFIAERTLCLSPEAAAFVDIHVAPVAHKIGPAQLDRMITEAVARFDAEVDLADALDLEAAVAAGAEEQRPRRQVVLHVHLSRAAVAGPGTDQLARVREVPGPVTVEQVRLWCGNPDTQVTVRPVVDLAEHIHVDSYQASQRLKDQVDLRDATCVFPHCTRPAHRCDHDHRVAHADGGPTCSCHLAPVCRRHHRAKTTGGWNYLTIEPGVHLWRSPLGYQFLRDATGTLDVTPDHQHRELARTFLAHFDIDNATDPEP